MQFASFSRFSVRALASLALGVVLLSSGIARAGSGGSISGIDANGKSVTVNGTGHYTVVLYTNPDLEDDTRKLTLALDSYRSKPNFVFVRVVDLRGGVPPTMRSIVKGKMRKEQVEETARLKKAGIDPANSAPIIADYTGSTLNPLGWDSLYDQVHIVIYDAKGREVKRLADVSSASEIKKAVDSVL